MSVLCCNSCNSTFEDESLQKAHYKSDWHRYNLKRKVAGLPGVTEPWFQKRKEAVAAQVQPEQRLLYKCVPCKKEYASEKAYNNHVASKAHASRVSSTESAAPQIRPQPVKEPLALQDKNGTPSAPQGDQAEAEEEDEWEEVDDEEAEELMAEGEVQEIEQENEAEEMEVEEWPADRCLFCDQAHAGDVEACVAHMHKAHGFFLPDAEYLRDPVGLLQYLGLKVSRGFMCLLCDDRGRQYSSLSAVRSHMESRSHCKLRYGDGSGIGEEELEEFYDFSESYESPEQMQLVLTSGLSDDSVPVSISKGGLELVIRSNGTNDSSSNTTKVIGSRDMARYYRQKPRPEERRDGVLASALVARYRSLGVITKCEWTGPKARQRDNGVKSGMRAEQVRSKIALRNNVNWNLPKNVPY